MKDKEARHAALHGVANSRTQLRDRTTTESVAGPDRRTKIDNRMDLGKAKNSEQVTNL